MALPNPQNTTFCYLLAHAHRRKIGYTDCQIKDRARDMGPNQTKLKLHEPASYRICVQGVLDPSWSDTFAGLAITCAPVTGQGPVTILTGQLIDQAMLLGVLNGLYGLGLPLLSVEWLVEGRSSANLDWAVQPPH
jgi:hypothetical protein